MNKCRFCCQKGHNIRTCQDAKQYAIKHPNSIVALKYNSLTTNICSYCHIGGHNKTTCTKLTKDFFLAIEENRKYRKLILEKFKFFGIGIGTIMEYSQYSVKKIIMIEKIIWENILYKNSLVSIITNTFGETTSQYNFKVNRDFWYHIDNQDIGIIKKSSERNMFIGKDKNWEKGISNIQKIDKFFEKF